MRTLLAAEVVVEWEPSDDGMNDRYIYASKDVADFYDHPRSKGADWGRRSVQRQMASFFEGFVAGDSLDALADEGTHPAFRKLRPKRKDGPCVWEARTPDVRVFGWFPGVEGTFVATSAAWKTSLQREDGSDNDEAYAQHRDGVVRWRVANGLDSFVWNGGCDELPTLLG